MEATNCQGYEAEYTNYPTKKAKAEADMQRKTDTKKAKAAAVVTRKKAAALAAGHEKSSSVGGSKRKQQLRPISRERRKPTRQKNRNSTSKSSKISDRQFDGTKGGQDNQKILSVLQKL